MRASSVAGDRAMKSTETLNAYLNDHLAGSDAALELLSRLTETAEQDHSRAAFASLRAEVEQDQRVLEDLIARVGGGESKMKRALGWLAEKAARVKLGSAEPGGSFALFESLEVLALGIQGKRSLWRALSILGDAEPALAGIDFDALLRRAEIQHDEVERWRLALARAALTEP